jgi:hypothetical protein
VQAVRRIQVPVHGVHGLTRPFGRGHAGVHRPALAIQEYLTLRGLVGADLAAGLGKSADVPLAVPELALAGGFHLDGDGGVVVSIGVAAQHAGGLYKGL